MDRCGNTVAKENIFCTISDGNKRFYRKEKGLGEIFDMEIASLADQEIDNRKQDESYKVSHIDEQKETPGGEMHHRVKPVSNI